MIPLPWDSAARTASITACLSDIRSPGTAPKAVTSKTLCRTSGIATSL